MLEFLAPTGDLPGFAVRALAAVAFTGAAAYYDFFNKKWVPDWIAYACIAMALAVNIIFFEQAIFLQALLFGAIVFAATFLLYKAGQLGGADVFTMAGIAACIPYLPSPILAPNQAIPYPFILSVMIPTGIVFILHMLVHFIPYISRRISEGKLKFTQKQAVEAFAIAASLIFFTIALSSLPIALPRLYLALFSFLAVSLLFFSVFKQEIKDSMVESIPAKKLCAEDVMAIEKIDAKTVKALSLSPLMDEKMIARIKKSKLKSVPVYTGMPYFFPYLLFGLVFTLLFGDLFLSLL